MVYGTEICRVRCTVITEILGENGLHMWSMKLIMGGSRKVYIYVDGVRNGLK